jgi:hypothetical protein
MAIVAMPTLVMLGFVAVGGALVAMPRRVVGALADGFGFAPDLTAHGGVKKVHS